MGAYKIIKTTSTQSYSVSLFFSISNPNQKPASAEMNPKMLSNPTIQKSNLFSFIHSTNEKLEPFSFSPDPQKKNKKQNKTKNCVQILLAIETE